MYPPPQAFFKIFCTEYITTDPSDILQLLPRFLPPLPFYEMCIMTRSILFPLQTKWPVKVPNIVATYVRGDLYSPPPPCLQGFQAIQTLYPPSLGVVWIDCFPPPQGVWSLCKTRSPISHGPVWLFPFSLRLESLLRLSVFFYRLSTFLPLIPQICPSNSSPQFKTHSLARPPPRIVFLPLKIVCLGVPLPYT